MSEPFKFDINKYTGIWYELSHYPTWYDLNDTYNTRANYTLNNDGTMMVHNSTFHNGVHYESKAVAKSVGCTNGPNFRVEFDKGGCKFVKPQCNKMRDHSLPNYMVDKVFSDGNGNYRYAIVVNPSRDKFHLLSRVKNPSLAEYNEVAKYVACNYDCNKIVLTPHFGCPKEEYPCNRCNM